MYKIDDFMSVMQEIAPLELSYKMIEKGGYDNSGLLVKVTENINKVMFSLDFSLNSVNKAIECGCDAIVTHHPAIYNPIKSLSIDGQEKALLIAIEKGINVISMHLNLDIAKEGIDSCLATGLGGKNLKVLDLVCGECGYGKVATVKEQTTEQFLKNAKQVLKSEKIIMYGERTVKKVASFCGSGASEALSNLNLLSGVDTIVTSDIAHHQLKEFIENGFNVMVIPHYASEQLGFNEFYKSVSKIVNEKAQTFYFLDERFM